MRIAQIAPLFESVPPYLYGGTERVVSWLTEDLVGLGNEVSLFASGDSQTTAKLIPIGSHALPRDADQKEVLQRHICMLETLQCLYRHFDILHFHCGFLHFPMMRATTGVANVTTLHGSVQAIESLLIDNKRLPLIAVSNDQRRSVPEANWKATIHHGLPRDHYAISFEKGEYLAFLGRVAPEKGLPLAINTAIRVGMPLKVAAKIYPEHRDYFERIILPLLRDNSSRVEFVGEIGGTLKTKFLAKASALLFPSLWPEPFGLVMIEAMACGTPVIAWNSGAASEIISDGENGFVVENVDEAVNCINHRLDGIHRTACRRLYEERFTSNIMTRAYIEQYKQIIAAV